jgi:hypothetical protein
MSSVILTSYFSKKIHPNHPNDNHVVGREKDGRVTQNSIEYIEPWYNSVRDLNIEGRVFYDNLSDEFIEEYETDKIKFIKVNTSDYSNNDWRFFCYKKYLEENKFDSIVLSDGSDVKVVKDPSDFVESGSYDFYVCKDSINLSMFPYLDFHKSQDWDDYVSMYLNATRWPLINMGVLGGSYENVIEFLNIFCEVRSEIREVDFNANMWIGQYVFRSLLKNKSIMIGEPFTSEFKKYQDGRKDVYFIHK